MGKFWLYVQALTFLFIVGLLFTASMRFIDRKIDEYYGFDSVVIYDTCNYCDEEFVNRFVKEQDALMAKSKALEVEKIRYKSKHSKDQ